jgi:hypothetical protein
LSNDSIQNSLFFSHMALASSPYHLPSHSDTNPVEAMPRLFISNNDKKMRVYTVATRTEGMTEVRPRRKRLQQSPLEIAGFVELETPVNHGMFRSVPLHSSRIGRQASANWTCC